VSFLSDFSFSDLTGDLLFCGDLLLGNVSCSTDFFSKDFLSGDLLFPVKCENGDPEGKIGDGIVCSTLTGEYYGLMILVLFILLGPYYLSTL